MSQIPRFGGRKPLINTTSTISNRTPAGGVQTTTIRKIRELQPCSSASQNQSRMGGCQPCPSRLGQKSFSQEASAIRTPRVPGPPATGRQGTVPQRRGAPVQLQPPVTGQYNVPAQFGPMTRAGKDMVYSSPAGLRGQMEAKIPKDLKYQNIKVCPGAGAKDRSALQGTTMGGMYAGNFNVYGNASLGEGMMDRSILNERV